MTDAPPDTCLNKPRVMSGMRPTGRLHLGHYFGCLKNWVALQDQYECFYSVADWHALTTKYDHTQNIVEDIYDIVLDWLAAGIEPDKSTIYVQSTIPEIAELHLLLSMMTPVKWVETDPTLKDMVQARQQAHGHQQAEADAESALAYGLLGYPVLQTADILGPRAALVPIGKDQEAHLEISRQIARRFNHMYQSDCFPEPKPLFTDISRLIGLDGRKMSKSYNNAIYLSDSDEATLKIIKSAITDPKRIKRDDPGEPKDCQAVFPYYEVFAGSEVIATVADECRSAKRGCMDCKKQLAEIINETLRPMRERRKVYAGDRAQVEKIIRDGCAHSRDIHAKTLTDVRKIMRLFPH
ncbi:MAG: tryptophan--tRNA ligase [Vampirovibrionales bacterium]|nr:tryptophan--tRNA ligase [Vampirovibrionales bacterium]